MSVVPQENSKMTMHLTAVKGWHTGMSCVPTALAAISSKTPTEIADVLTTAARSIGETIASGLLQEYPVRVWLKAVELLDGAWWVAGDYAECPLDMRPSIGEWMNQNPQGPLTLVYCSSNLENASHVFAAENGQFVDVYTQGQKIRFCKPPAEFLSFRVKYLFCKLS